MSLTLYHTILSFNDPDRGLPKTLWEKEPAFALFSMFSTRPKTNFKFSVTFIVLSATAFNFDQSKTLSFGKELILYQTTKF